MADPACRRAAHKQLHVQLRHEIHAKVVVVTHAVCETRFQTNPYIAAKQPGCSACTSSRAHVSVAAAMQSTTSWFLPGFAQTILAHA